MNLLGKIFTVLILITSIVLMVVAMFVYSTHRTGRRRTTRSNAKFQAAQTANANAETQYLAQITQLKSEQSAAVQDVAKLETERNVIVSQNQAIQKEVDQLRQDRLESVALVKATEENTIA